MLVEVAGIVELGMSGALGRGSVLLLKSARDERERLSRWRLLLVNEGREGVIRPEVWAGGAPGIGESRRRG